MWDAKCGVYVSQHAVPNEANMQATAQRNSPSLKLIPQNYILYSESDLNFESKYRNRVAGAYLNLNSNIAIVSQELTWDDAVWGGMREGHSTAEPRAVFGRIECDFVTEAAEVAPAAAAGVKAKGSGKAAAGGGKGTKQGEAEAKKGGKPPSPPPPETAVPP